MATEQNLQCYTLPAAADLSAKQYHFVVVNSQGQVAACTAGAQADGVLQDKPAAGQAANVAHSGITKIVYGGTVTAGADLASDSNGRAVTASSPGAAILGVAIEGGTSGTVGSMLLRNAGYIIPEPEQPGGAG